MHDVIGLLHLASFVYMNCIKTCINVGKKCPGIMCPALLDLARELSDETKFPRVVEVFDTWLGQWEHESFDPVLESFVEASLRRIESDHVETGISVLNFLSKVLSSRRRIFMAHHEEIFRRLNLTARPLLEANLETEGILQLSSASSNCAQLCLV